ncbi:MAG: HlyD family efflux transporter periplasmic adaptor subunit [Chitinivibrionales bacterium]|nr:HlyD family efflux transporter periplasmic adaptor subunit [Chitinivibrionales bacterium]
MKPRKILFLTLLFLSAILTISCRDKKSQFDASGVFEAVEIIVSSEAAGKILRFDVEEGETLQANQNVGAIDSIQLYLRKMQLLASVKAVRSRRPDVDKQIAAIQQQIITAKTEKLRIENLLRSNAANQKQLDDINGQIAILEKQLDAQKSTLSITNTGITDESSALEIQVAQLDDQLQKCQIINPITGVVLAKYCQATEITAPGKALYKIADMQNMTLRAYIISSQLTQLKIGQQIKVFADFGEKGTKQYSGTVAWIASKAEFTPKTIQTRDERANLVYAIKISVKNDGFLKIGMYGALTIGVK